MMYCRAELDETMKDNSAWLGNPLTASSIMWQFLAVLAIAGGLLDAVRQVEVSLGGEGKPEPRRWTLQKPDPPPHFIAPCELEKDAWKVGRQGLNEDVWEDQRARLDEYIPSEWSFPLLERKQFILEDMDGGLSTYSRMATRNSAK
jgi:hypothetical protein